MHAKVQCAGLNALPCGSRLNELACDTRNEEDMKSRFTHISSVLIIGMACCTAAADQGVIARIKVHNAGSDPMANAVVRGALPLPAGYGKPLEAIGVRVGGKAAPAQVSVMSTYPGSSERFPVGSPEVIQLAFRADLPAGAPSEFEVVQGDAAADAKARPAAPGEALAGILRGDTPVLVEAVDCYGNRYQADVLDPKALLETRQAGAVMVERVYRSVLTLVGTAPEDKPALERFLVVRAYLTTFAGEDFASLALMIHNGTIDRPNGDVFYRQIRVGVAQPAALAVWRQEYSPAAEGKSAVEGDITWLSCPPPHPDGKVYVMPYGSAAVLRGVLYAPGAEKRAKEFDDHAPLFVPVPGEGLFSWSNPATARYGSNKYPMPLAVEQDAFDSAGKDVQGRLASGTLGWDLTYMREKPAPRSRTMGHAMPAGVGYGGMTGGQGVHYVFGVRAALTGHNGLIQMHVLLADRNFDRQRVHLFHDDGHPYTHSRRVVDEQGRKYLDVPYTTRGYPILKPADPAAVTQAKHVQEAGLLAPEAAALLRYNNHDDQHLSRVFDAEPAAYLGCDPVNRDRLVTLGSQACWKRNLYPIRTMKTFSGWGSLLTSRQHVDKHPGEGIGMDRAHGWVTHSLGWAHCLSKDPIIRADCIEVAKADVAVRAKAQMPAGNVTFRGANAKAFQGKYDFTTAWEEGGIMADGARCVVKMLDAPDTRADAEVMKGVYARVGRWIATKAWDDKANSPAFFVGLRERGAKEMLDVPVTSGSAAFYMGSPLAWYYELTGEKVFLDRLHQMSGPPGLAARSLRELGNWSYSLYLAQTGKDGRGE